MPDMQQNGNISLEPGPILVTGAAGFAGYHLMKELGMGEGDFAADVNTDFEAPEGVTRISWSLPSTPPAELGFVRYIIHLAAMSSVSESLKEVHRVYQINLMGTLSVLEYMISECPKAKMLLVSSSEVYKSTDDLISENCEIGPNVCLFPATSLGDNVLVSPFTQIRNSVIGDNVYIGPGSSWPPPTIPPTSTLVAYVTVEPILCVRLHWVSVYRCQFRAVHNCRVFLADHLHYHDSDPPRASSSLR